MQVKETSRQRRDLAKSIVGTDVFDALQGLRGYGLVPDIIDWAKANSKSISDVTLNRAIIDGMATDATFTLLLEYVNYKKAAA